MGSFQYEIASFQSKMNSVLNINNPYSTTNKSFLVNKPLQLVQYLLVCIPSCQNFLKQTAHRHGPSYHVHPGAFSSKCAMSMPFFRPGQVVQMLQYQYPGGPQLVRQPLLVRRSLGAVIPNNMQILFQLVFCLLKGIWYGSEPVVISLQLTNFQSLIGLRMHRIVFREDPKSHLPVSRACTFFKYTITANGKNDISGKKIHFLQR